MSDATIGYRYLFDIHMGLWRGLDGLKEIRVGDRTAWAGNVTANAEVAIDAYNLFGGESGEGGVRGTLNVMFGGPTQVAPDGLKTLLRNAYGDLIPGFRRTVTAFYSGIVSMFNPYPKTWKIRGYRRTADWDGDVFAPAFIAIPMLGAESEVVSGVTGGQAPDRALRFTPTYELFYELLEQGNSGWSINYLTVARATYDDILMESHNTWTCECYVRFPTQGPTGDGPAQQGSMPIFSSSYGWSFAISKDLSFVICTNDAGGLTVPLPSRLALNRRYHIALKITIRSDNSPRMFVWLDGVPVAEVSELPPITPLGSGTIIGGTFHGLMDRIRITAGARYTEQEFTPPVTLATGAADIYWSDVLLLIQPDGELGSTTLVDVSDAARTPTSVVGIAIEGVSTDQSSVPNPETDRNIAAMNPAAIVYECLTNRDWGRGLARTRLDSNAYLAAAEALFDEGFGMCVQWDRTSPIEDFIQEQVDAIGAVQYQDRSTGKLVLKLLRGDYTFADLPILDSSSGLLSIDEAPIGAQTEFVTEVIVKYHDPIHDVDASVRVQSLAALQASGGVVKSVTRNYPGVPTAKLAMRLAQRDLKAMSSSLRRFVITCDRRAWAIYPGSVVRIRDLQRRIPDMAIRVATWSEDSSSRIRIVAVQDVFSLPATSYGGVMPPAGTASNVRPCVGQSRSTELPYALLARYMSPADFAAVTPEASRFGLMVDEGQALNSGLDLSVKDGEPDVTEFPSDDSYFCGYAP